MPIYIKSLTNYFLWYYQSYFIIDSRSFFAYIMAKRKIVSHYLKKVDIFVFSTYYYIKTDNSNKNFILMAIVITFFYYIKIRIKVTTIITFIWIFIRIEFIGSIIFVLGISKVNIFSLAFLLIILKWAMFSTFYC